MPKVATTKVVEQPKNVKKFEIYQSANNEFVKKNGVLCPDCPEENFMENKNGIYVCQYHRRFTVAERAIEIVKDTKAFNHLCFPICLTCNRILLNVVHNVESANCGKLFFTCACTPKPKVFMFLDGKNKAIKPVEENMSAKYLDQFSAQAPSDVVYHSKLLQ